MSAPQSPYPNRLASTYLFYYNVAQAIDWSVVLVSTVLALFGGASLQDAFLSGATPASEWPEFDTAAIESDGAVAVAAADDDAVVNALEASSWGGGEETHSL